MEVRCAKCDTTYELDESQVKESGVHVKCARCGHLFVVRKRIPVTREMPGLRVGASQVSPVTPRPEPASRESGVRERGWQLRLKRNQEVLRFRDLGTLVQWISARRVSRDDDLSRSGRKWVRLGSIVELESIFHAAELSELARLRKGGMERQSGATTETRSARSPERVPEARAMSSSASGRREAPLPRDPPRLRSDTPGQGIGPPPSAARPGSQISPPRDRPTPSILGPGAVTPRSVEASTSASLRMSTTGRSMRPRLRQEAHGEMGAQAKEPAQTAAPGPPRRPSPQRPAAPGTNGKSDPPKKTGGRPGEPARIPIVHRAPAREACGASAAQGPSIVHEVLVDTPPPAPGPLEAPPPELFPAAPLPSIEEVIRRSDPVPRALMDAPALPRTDALRDEGHELDLSSPEPPESAGSRQSIDIDEDLALVRPSRLWVYFLGGALMVGAFSLLYKLAHDPPPRSAPSESKGSADYREGRRLAQQDTDESFQQAHDLFVRASVAEEKSPAPLAALGELHALWAHYLREDAAGAASGQAALLEKAALFHLQMARRYIDQASALDPTSPEVNRALALLMLENGAPADQIQVYLDRSLSRAPDDAETLHARALLLVRDQRLEEARDLLRKARAASTEPGLRASVLLGQVEAALGNREEARQILAQVIRQSPVHVRAEQALAGLSTPRGAPAARAPEDAARRPPAEAQGTKAPSPERHAPTAAPSEPSPKRELAPPRDHHAQLELAEELIEKSRYREAQRIYQQMLPEHDGDPQVHAGLGACARAGERFQAAAAHYRAALARRPHYPPALLGLAEVYRLRGDPRQASEWYGVYLEKYPQGPEAERARAQLERMRALLQTDATPPLAPREETAPP